MIASTVLLQLKIYIDLSRWISWFAYPLGDGGRGVKPFFGSLYSRNLGQIGILAENWHFEWGNFFR